MAPELIGCLLTHRGVGGVVVEVEAYDQDDPASHSHRGPTRGNLPMFAAAGRVYVYRSYGVHWCLNIVCGEEGRGEAVLVRALEPTLGLGAMRARRGRHDVRRLCSGPGRLTEALAVDGRLSGSELGRSGVVLGGRDGPAPRVASGPRIGITRAVERPWRFALEGSPFLSRPLPRTAAA